MDRNENGRFLTSQTPKPNNYYKTKKSNFKNKKLYFVLFAVIP